MKDFINEVFDKHEVEAVYREYVLENSNSLPQFLDLWGWDKVLMDLSEKLEFDNEYMLKSYEMMMKSTYLSSFTDFLDKKLSDDNLEYEENQKIILLKSIDLLTKAGNNDIFDIYYRIIDISSGYSLALAEYMCENQSKEDIIKNLSSYELSYNNAFLLRDLYRVDSDSFTDLIIDISKKSNSLENYLAYFLAVVKNKDKDILKELITQALSTALKGRYIKDKDISILLDFIEGKKDKKFDKTITTVSSKLKKKDESIYFISHVMTWLKETDFDTSDDYFQNFKVFACNMQPYDSIKELLSEKTVSKEVALSEYSIPFNLYLQFLFGASEDWYNGDLKENSIKELKKYCVSDFEEFKIALLLNKNDFVLATIKDFYDENVKGFNKMLVEMAPTATSKTMKKFIIGILERNKENKSILLKLLKDKKAPSREIAVSILINWKLDDTKSIIEPLLKTEKNKAVKILVEDYMSAFKLETTDESDFFSKSEILKRAKKEQVSVYGMEVIPLMTWKEDNKDLAQYFTKYIIALLNKGDKILKARPEAKKVISLLTDDSISKLIDSVTDDYAKTSDWYLRALPFTKEDKYLDELKEYIG